MLLSPSNFSFFFLNISLSLLSRKSRGFFQSRSRSVAARSSVGGLRMTSCDRSPRKRSGSLTLSPSCLARSLPRSRRLGSLFVAPPSSSRPSLSRPLDSARRRSRLVSFSTWRRAPAREREKERVELAHRAAGRREKERDDATRERVKWHATCASAKNVYTYRRYLRGGKSTPREQRLPRREGRSERTERTLASSLSPPPLPPSSPSS